MSPHSEHSYSGETSIDSTPSLINVNGNTTVDAIMATHINGTENGVNGNDSHGSSANGHSNGHSNGHTNATSTHRSIKKHSERSKYLVPSADPTSEYDLICVGFGPASLAVAVALHDSLAASSSSSSSSSPSKAPQVLFLEKQQHFAWHAGMLLPGAKMQISFIKDLATMRDPRSEFTFLNYLHRQGRLVDFTNLSTFLPARVEYEDYMRWCSSFFDDVVQYGRQVVSVSPEAASQGLSDASQDGSEAVRTFTVQAQDVKAGTTHSYRSRNVLVAAGGQPSLPREFLSVKHHPRVLHSSQYAHMVPQLLPKSSAPYRVAVIGAGQSAAEIFHNVQNLYPNSKTSLVMRQEFLRPSDDSPLSASHRSNLIAEARATNYGVVRLELIEALYERLYEQRRELGPHELTWPHRILGGRQIARLESSPDNGPLKLWVRRVSHFPMEGEVLEEQENEDLIEADLIIAATGYQRNAHVEMLRDTWSMLPGSTSKTAATFSKGIAGWDVETPGSVEGEKRKMAVGRDYKVRYAPGRVANGSGVWLQGCCEGTHGLSDTLLSVLATRSGEIVESIFGDKPSQR